MREGKTAYFCTSTYQLFSILPLAMNRQEKADLYIDPQFKDAEKIASKIEGLILFEKVKIIPSEEIYNKYFSCRKGFLNHLQIARNYLRTSKISIEILGEEVRYENIIVSSRAFMPRMVYLHSIKKKYHTTLYYCDDGVGSYCADSVCVPRLSDRIVRRVIFGKEAVNVHHTKFLLSPSTYFAINPDTQDQVESVTIDWEDPNWNGVLETVFQISDFPPIEENVVLLEEPYASMFSPDAAKRIQDIYKKFADEFGQDVIVKRHPRNENAESDGFKYYNHFGLPFELLCKGRDMENMVLVSYASTAIASPKVLFDKEPYMILLYKMVESSMNSDALDEYFVGIKASYRDHSKCFIPKNMEELEAAMQQIKDKTGK